MPATLLPLFSEAVQAGFPSPAQGYMEDPINLNDLCIRHPAATCLYTCDDESMISAGIFPGDYLVVDRSLKPKDGDVVIADLEGQHQLRKLLTKVRPRLVADGTDALMIDLEPRTIVGVVVTAVKPLHRQSLKVKHG